MNLFDVLRRDCIQARVQVADKPGALREVARIARQSPELASVPEAEIEAALVRREELGSTGFGNGIAIPHCRMDSVDSFVVGVISVPDGVDFDALDDEPVRLLVFIVAPAIESDQHVRLLSGISQVLSIPGAIKELVAGASDDALYESFLRHAHDKVDTQEARERVLFHVFVQEEDYFREILQVFGAMDDGAVVILDAENSSAYLAKMPMFAGFWTDNPRTFSRMIVALVSKGLANETIRRIERVTGDLKEQSGVMVAVQDVFYCEGALNA